MVQHVFAVGVGLQHFVGDVLHGAHHRNSVHLHCEESGRLCRDGCVPAGSVGVTYQEDLVDTATESVG